MTILTQTTNYSEANSGDTTNPGANFGNVSQGNWPLLGFDSSGKAVFSGTLSSSSDSDFFAIDIAGGTHDWSGSLGASAGFTATVSLSGGGGTFTIQGRREDYTYLGNFGPYGSNTVVYNSSTDPSTVTVSNAAWKSSWGSGGSTNDYVLGFQVVGYGYTGGYTITIQTDNGGGGGGGGGSQPNLSAKINSLSAASVTAGSQLTINTSIINSGDGNAGSEQVGYYLATDSNFTNNVRFLGYVTLPGVASHVETVFPNIIFTIPADVAAGSYYIRAVANYDHQISNETNFNDNASSGVAITVTHQPLVLVDDTLKFTGTTGASMNILANDRDPDGDSLSILAVRGNPKWGRIETNANGTVTYYPNQTLTPSAAGPDGHIRDNVLIDVTDGHGDTGTEKFNVDFIYGDYIVNLPDVTVSPALIPGPYRNPGPAPGAPIPLVLGNPDGHVELQGHLVHNQSVAYKFHVPPFYTLFLDYRQEAQFEDPNAPNYLQYVASPNTTPWLRASPDNIHPVFTVDQAFGGGHILNLSNLGGAYLGHTPGARWYEDPLMPGDYYFTITNTEFDSPAGSQEWPLLSYNIYAWLGPDDAGNNAYWARDLGTISGAANPNPPNDPNFIDRTKSYVEYVSRVDDKDYYSFTLTKPSAVSIALVTQTPTFGNNVHLYEDDTDSSAVMGLTHYLIPSAQQYRDIQTTAGRDTPLPAGTYFFSVEKPSGHSYDLDADYTDGVQQSEEDRQNYKVFVTVWDDNANHTAANATDLGLIDNTTLTRGDNVSIANPNDWYKFHVSSASTVNISVAPTHPAFTVGIEFARFNPIDLSILPATNSYIVFANSGADGNALPLGPNVQIDPNVTYWVRVFEKKTYPLLDNITYDNPFAYPDDGSTDYNLSIKTTTIPPGSAPDITGDPGPNLLIGANGPVISGASRMIRGMGGGDTIYTGPGNNTVVGGPGNNTYTAGSGFNTLDYSGSSNGTTINLRNGMAQNGYGGTDTISSFKAFVGSAANDAFLVGPGNVALDGRGGTDTVAFTGQYANYTISYNATTKTDTITDVRSGSPDGANTVTNVEIVQFTDGTANLDSAGRLASAIVNNSDGSRTAYAWDTQNQYNWSDYTISTDAQGRTTTQTTDYDNGTRSLEVWDVLNKNTWADYIYNYDSQGRTTGQTVDYHNGTRTVQTWDVLNQNTWSDYVWSYDAQGRTTSQTIDYRNGTHTVQTWDVLNQNSWSDNIVTYDSQWRTVAQTIDYRSGTHTVQTWDVLNQNSWSDNIITYDAQWRTLSQMIDYRNGTRTIETWDALNQNSWLDKLVSYDAQGRVTSQMIDYRNGTRTIQTWDVLNQNNWIDKLGSYDTQGRMTSQANDYRDGTHSLQTWDVLNATAWSDNIISYDSQWRQTSQTVHYRNGTQTIQTWDVQNQNTWSDYVYSYDTQGRTTSQTVDYRSGIRTAQYWDVLSQNIWSDWVGYYDSQNRETTHFVDNDDGTHTAQYFDVQSQNTWTSWVGSYDSQNRQTAHFVNNHDGTRTAQYFDVLNQNPWTDYVYAYDSQGRLTSQTIDYRDSHHTVQMYDVSGTQTWSSVLTSYDSSWHQTSQTFVHRAPPVVLDLDGNGIDITPLSASTASFDMGGTGERLPTAWVGGHDGLLAIDLGADGRPGPDGVIDQGKEINFTLWAPDTTSDLQALREVFDTDHDGKLDPGDGRWNEFRVWTDANSDGISQPGELKTLSDLGITSIDLNPSPSSKSFSDGSSIQGLSSFVRRDGSTGLVGDAVFAYASTRSADLSALALGANSSTTVPTFGDGTPSANLALLGSYMASTFAGASGDHGGAPIGDASLIAAQTPFMAQPHA